MPPSPASGPVDGAAPSSPPSVRVAVALLATLAALLLLYVLITGIGRAGLLEALTESGLSRGEAERYLLVNSTAPLALGLLHAVSAWALATQRSWSRWTGLTGSVALALLVVSTVLTAGGVTAVSLLQLVLSVAAAASVMARTTREWLAAARG